MLMDQSKLTLISADETTILSPTFIEDNLMIFLKSTKKNAQAINNLLQEYDWNSSQHVSPTQCKLYDGASFGSRLRHIVDMIEFNVGHSPFNHLGFPIFKGKPRNHHLQIIADKVLDKLATWKSQLLSVMGRVQLIQSIIQDMLIYSLRIYEWPKRIGIDQARP